MMSYIILFQHLNKCPVRDVIVFPSFQRFRVDGRKRFEYATLYMWTHTFSKTEEKFLVFKNIRMLVGRSLKDLVLLGTRPKFGFRRAAECLKPCWLTLFMTKKILKYPYPVQENTLYYSVQDKEQNASRLLLKQFIGNCNGANSRQSNWLLCNWSIHVRKQTLSRFSTPS